MYTRYHKQGLHLGCKSSFSVNLQQSYGPLFDVRIQFFFNILRTNRLIETKFCIHIIFDKIYFGIVKRYFSQLCNKITALDIRQDMIFLQYLENE